MFYRLSRWLFSSLFLISSIISYAHNFETVNSEGVTIYYKITSDSDKTVSVTYKGANYTDYAYEYSGSVNIPSKVTYDNITFSVTSIEHHTFWGCSGVTSISIPNSVTEIGKDAFSGCKLTEPLYNDNCFAFMPNSYSGAYEIPYGVKLISGYAFNSCYGLTSVVIPNSVETIDEGAFYNCTGLKSISIPESVIAIEAGAFYNCSGLTSISIPNSVTSLGHSVFVNCTGLKDPIYNTNSFAYMPKSFSGAFTIPSGIKQIAGSSFNGCTGLTSLTIPNSVTRIDQYAFSGCTALASVDIPESVTSIGREAFNECTSLTTISLPNSITTIGQSAFNKCTGLTEPVYNANCFAYMPRTYSGDYEIAAGIKQIVGNSFYYSNITSITIPASVTNIDNCAFYGSDMTSIKIKKQNPSEITLGSSVFEYIHKSTCTLYVPKGSKSLYASAAQWMDFENIEEFEPTVEPNDIETPDKFKRGDVDGNGKLTVADVVALVNMILEGETE